MKMTATTIRLRLAIVFALCVAAAIWSDGQASAADSVATWKTRFDTVLANNDQAGSNYCNTKTADADELASGGIYCLDALHRMYELTGDTAYLDKLEQYAYNMRSTLSYNSEVYLSWRSAATQNESLRQIASIIYQWANFIVTVRSDPDLADDYAGSAMALEETINTNLLPRWDKLWSEQYGVYLSTASPAISLNHNDYMYMARALYRMAEASPSRTEYIARADRMAAKFKSYLANSGTGYTWNRRDQITASDSSSVSTQTWDYAFIELGAAMESYRRGGTFGQTEMTRFANGVYANMWDGSTGDPKLSRYVDGTSPDDGEFTLDYGDMTLWNSNIWALFEKDLSLRYSAGGGARTLNDIAIVLQHHAGQATPAAFDLNFPASSATGQNTTIGFRWEPADNAASYTLQVSTDALFSSFVVDRSHISRTGALVTGLANNTTYYWRVIAKSAGGTTNSSTFSFATGAAPTYTLTFSHRDDRQNIYTGYHWKQVLIDDVVVWEADTSVDAANAWIDASVDITAYLAGKDKATIKLRLLDKISTGGNYSVNVWWDNVSITNADVWNGGMEEVSVPWYYTEVGAYFDRAIDTSVKKTGFSSYRLFLPENITTAPGDYAAVQLTWGLKKPELAQGSVATWKSRFDEVLAELDTPASNYAYSDTADSALLAWGGAYGLDALWRMYNLTKDSAYIAKLSAYIDNNYDHLGDTDSDGYLGWGTQVYDPTYTEYYGHIGAIVYQWANFILAVRSDSVLAASTNPQGITYAQQADELEAVIHDDLLPKWDIYWSTQYKLYYSENSLYPNYSSPYNLYSLMAKAMYKMFEVDPSKMHYLMWADDLMKLFKDHVSVKGAGYKWNYWDHIVPADDSSVYLEDWSHTIPNFGGAIQAYSRGHSGYNSSEMGKFANTIYGNMWNGSYREPLIALRVDGSLPHVGEFTLDFGDMSLWEPDLWNVFEKYQTAHWSPYYTGVRKLNDIAILLQHHPGQAAPQSFALASPANSATNGNVVQSFQWEAAENASRYTLQVSTSSLFGSYTVNRDNILTPGAIVSGLAYNTTYYWRVIAHNASGTSTSSTRSFTTKTSAPTYTLTFSHRDDRQNIYTGYHWKQILIDDVVVWEADTSVDAVNTWIDSSVDVTAYLAGKDKATIKLRLFDKISTGGNYSVNVWWDDVSITSTDMQNGGMEPGSVPWHYTEVGSYFDKAIDTSVKKNGSSSYRLFLPENITTAAGDYAAIQMEWALRKP